MVTYHEIDNAQLQEKLDLLLPETGSVKQGKGMSKATAAIRLNQEHAFMKQYVTLMQQRKHLHTDVLAVNHKALHGLSQDKKKVRSLAYRAPDAPHHLFPTKASDSLHVTSLCILLTGGSS